MPVVQVLACSGGVSHASPLPLQSITPAAPAVRCMMQWATNDGVLCASRCVAFWACHIVLTARLYAYACKMMADAQILGSVYMVDIELQPLVLVGSCFSLGLCSCLRRDRGDG